MTVRILQGDCRDLLPTLDAGSMQTVVTSPPYYALRDYGVEGQIGLEGSVDEYVDTLVGVFREVKRVLKDDGTLWLNMGDTYAGGGNGGGGSFAQDGGIRTALPGTNKNHATRHGKRGAQNGVKTKDLMGLPWMVAFALRADGWYLRSDIIWSKPNPMPESVTDRPTKAHEYIFLLTKQPKYFYDADAIRTPSLDMGRNRVPDGWDTRRGNHSVIDYSRRERTDKPRGAARPHTGFRHWDEMSRREQQANGANARTVWEIATHPYPGAHFATFPPELAKRCILAGSRPGDTVMDPFGGRLTTGLVADRLQRHAVLIEINPAYTDMGRRDIVADAPLFAEVVG